MAPVHHLGAVPHLGPRPSYYIVRKGDTLYSIGWRYGVHYRTLAHWNKIRPPYTIYVGQKLRLTSPSRGASKSQSAVSTSKLKQPVDDKKAKVKLAASPPLVEAKASTSERIAKTVQGIRWYWPTEGEVIRQFSHTESGRKGVDIGGQLGQPIVAAADGKVVYSGMGLPRYGKLIIVKHDANFLSAYAHNQLLISQEGELVKGGQKIAEMGRSGTDRVKLHFEIRHQGRPVDPLRYLPK
ncbi:peptidoglycan DD-metalloendopeptidase family protein [Nitrosococcus wardiae]|uniref:LysM peptidoglycan-binding domain-containing protein n=1 Tax=Nitrosococcus wardiae TaxID=1814290 RepID=A0A4P7BXG7_9GAMM|nr:peptidoglycan DD-metalloendopeptidase family protein [Nitrosococcus wardiae]QBQ54701.1 LysM peptidoglycan-binding domain-containing protein [Nitrosococcus wardiae]